MYLRANNTAAKLMLKNIKELITITITKYLLCKYLLLNEILSINKQFCWSRDKPRICRLFQEVWGTLKLVSIFLLEASYYIIFLGYYPIGALILVVVVMWRHYESGPTKGFHGHTLIVVLKQLTVSIVNRFKICIFINYIPKFYC